MLHLGLVKSQVYTLISPSVGKNCDLFVFRLRTNSDLEEVIDELSAIAPGGRKQVLEMYHAATSKPFGFLFCELSKDARAPDEGSSKEWRRLATPWSEAPGASRRQVWRSFRPS